MKTVRLLILIISIFLLGSCFSSPQKAVVLGPIPEYREENTVFEVIGHENTAELPAESGMDPSIPGEDMPEWVVRYIGAGLTGIETLPEYENKYVFVGKQAGNNLNALKLWAGGFSVEHDFSRLVSARIQARFTGFSGGNPGEEFGRYFEAVVKKSADTLFNGANLESSFWIKKRIFDDDGLNPVGESFEYYTLVSIEKEILVKQINLLLITSRSNLPPTREQSSAAMRLRLSFYEGF